MLHKPYITEKKPQRVYKKSRKKRRKKARGERSKIPYITIALIAIIISSSIFVSLVSQVKTITTRIVDMVNNWDFFHLKQISIQGNKKIGLEEFKKWSGIQEGLNIFSLDLDKIVKLAEAQPWIRSLEVERRLPASLSIQIEESCPVAIWEEGERYFLMDEFGILLEEVKEKSGLPVLTSGEKVCSEAGKRCPSPYWSEALSILERIKIGYPELMEEISSLLLKSENEIIISLSKDRKLLVNLDNLDGKIYGLRNLLKKRPNLWDSEDYCDIRFKDQIIFGQYAS